MTEARTLVMEREFPHPPERLWRALTQPHLIAEWLLPNDFALEDGHRFTLQSPGAPGWSGRIDCAVREIEPGRRLSYSWDTGGEGEAMPRFESVVTLTIEPVARGCAWSRPVSPMPPIMVARAMAGACSSIGWKGWPRGWREVSRYPSSPRKRGSGVTKGAVPHPWVPACTGMTRTGPERGS